MEKAPKGMASPPDRRTVKPLAAVATDRMGVVMAWFAASALGGR